MTAPSPIQWGEQSPTATPNKLWNRAHATQRLVEELNHARSDKKFEFSVLLVEFAGLSEITDRLGYSSADGVWGQVLGALNEDLNSNDLCCRLGGDEFLLILPGKGALECQFLVERLRRWSPRVGSREAAIVLNIGIASCPAQGTIESLLAVADESSQADRDRNELLRSPGKLSQLRH